MREVDYMASDVAQNSSGLCHPNSPPSIVTEYLKEAGSWRQGHAISFLAADLILIFAAAYFATSSRLSLVSPNWVLLNHITIFKHFSFFVFYAGFFLLTSNVYNVYLDIKRGSARQELLALTKAVGMATFLVAVFIYLSGIAVSSLAVGETIVLSTLAMMGLRLLRLTTIMDGLDCRNVLIVGAGSIAQDLERHLSQNPHLGFSIKGYLDRRQCETPSHRPERRRSATNLPMLGTVEDLPLVARNHFVDEVFITASENREFVKRLILNARRSGIDARVVSDLYGVADSATPIEYFGQVPVMRFCHQAVPAAALLIKRCIDIIIAIVSLALLLPLLIAVAVAIKLSSPGPIFYRSTRIGRKGRDFICYKFRTMVANAEQLKESLHHLNERDDILFKIENDPRLTVTGRFLRKYSIDEIPQFLNVLKGNMSVVGPRPAVPGEYQQYALEHLRRLDVVPGITGLWQVAARQDPSFQSYIALDLKYVDSWSVWLDCKILIRTIAVVFAGTGQ